MAAQAKVDLWVNVKLSQDEKIMARSGKDLELAARMSGVGAKYPDHRFTDKDGRTVDEDNPRLYGTNFVAKPIDRFSFLDAMEEALGTDVYRERAHEYDLQRRSPMDLYGNLTSNIQHVIKVILGRDPQTGKDYPRDTPPPHVLLEQKIQETQVTGRSAIELFDVEPAAKL